MTPLAAHRSPRGRAVARLILAWLLLAVAVPAWAHKPSDSYLTLAIAGHGVRGQWDIALRDLDFALGLDSNTDGELTWGEVRAHHADVAAYAIARLHLRDGRDRPCPLRVDQQLVDRHSDGTYAVLRLAAECPQAIEALTVDYRLFFDLDRQHKGLLNLSQGERVASAVFSPDRAVQRFTLAELSLTQAFSQYIVEGIRHIGIGIDHILFLLSLLIPAVLTWQARRWQPVPDFRAAFVDVVKIVTAFTVAHSITLSLATLGVVQLPSRAVESVIALSVVLAALNNLRPTVLRGRWLVAFGFGLIHGFGFASVLADLGLPQQALLVALVGFNLGVEVGQLTLASVFLPVAFWLRRTRFYRLAVLTGGSAAIVAVASVWLVERAFVLRIISR